ncbi:hypothetical protein [Leptospirillum ferriphilum]|uniref:hypothetical protein n=1 Tax=Leptospirillum ferriphilum TaxID=178606 RepID=UPI0006B15716|nr:hypothetical protein [Leptospirillum ferriphilum]
MSRFLSLLIVSLLILVTMTNEAWAVTGSSFSACVAEGEVTYAPATAATLSAAGGAESGVEAAGAAALASDLAAAASATGGCLGAVPCGIAASLGASAAAFPEIYGSAEAGLTPVAQTPGGVATGAFGGMGIVEPFSGPGYWIPVAGGLVLNLESYAVALHGAICAASTNINTALSAVASALSSDVHNTARLVDSFKTHLGLIRERMRMEREYQPTPNLCVRSQETAANGPALSSVVQTAGTIDSSLNAVDEGLSSSLILSSASSWPEPSASDLFGSGEYTLTPQEISSGIRTIWLLTHSTGHVTATGSETRTTGAVLPQTTLARQSLIRHILTNLFALRVPQSAGGASLMQEIGTQIQERWGNPQWLVDLHTMHPATIRREIVLEKSLSSQIRYLRMISRQHRTALLAMIAAEGTDR